MTRRAGRRTATRRGRDGGRWSPGRARGLPRGPGARTATLALRRRPRRLLVQYGTHSAFPSRAVRSPACGADTVRGGEAAAHDRVRRGVQRLADLRVVRGLHGPGDESQVGGAQDGRVAGGVRLRAAEHGGHRGDDTGFPGEQALHLVPGAEPGELHGGAQLLGTGVDEIAPASRRRRRRNGRCPRSPDAALPRSSPRPGRPRGARVDPGVRPVAQEQPAPVDEGVLRVRLLVRGHGAGRDPTGGELGHQREGPLRLGAAQYGPAPPVQDGGARVGEELGDVGRQRLGHRRLPQEPGLDVTGLLHRAGGAQQLLPAAGNAQPVLGEKVLAVEEVGAVGEERYRVGRAPVRGAGAQGRRVGVPEAAREQLLHRQRERGVTELRGPRRVAQVHVGLGEPAGELGGDGAAVAVRGGQCVDLRDADTGMPPLEGTDDQIRDDGAPPGGDLGDPPGQPG